MSSELLFQLSPHPTFNISAWWKTIKVKVILPLCTGNYNWLVCRIFQFFFHLRQLPYNCETKIPINKYWEAWEELSGVSVLWLLVRERSVFHLMYRPILRANNWILSTSTHSHAGETREERGSPHTVLC